MDELVVPPEAIQEQNSIEMLRAFIVNGEQSVACNNEFFRGRRFSEGTAWGVFLADTIRHIADEISHRAELQEEDVITDIVEALTSEIVNPT